MKPDKDNTVEAVSFIFNGMAAAALTYGGSRAFPVYTHSNMVERILAVPAEITVYVVAPELPSGFIIMGWVGSFLIYFALGLVILVVVQSWLKKRSARKKETGTRI
jgi:hypothetical protein